MSGKNNSRKVWMLLSWMVIAALLVSGCSSTQAKKTYTIGVINYFKPLESIVEGFKTGMTELGYVEGENVTYIYNGVLEDNPQVIDAEVKNLLDQKVDMLLTLGNPTTLSAIKAVEGTKIPVVFAPVTDPVGLGVAQSLGNPGGSATGVQSANNAPKALEWLVKILPGTKQVYVFYNPIDGASVSTLKPLPDAAAQLGIELVANEVQSPEEELAIIKTMPEDAAIFIIPAPSLGPGLSDVKKLAIELGIPAGGYNDTGEDLVFSYTSDRIEQGKQAARLADQIFNGSKPGDLPVETAESFLRINLKVATAMGIDIPDSIIAQADTVIR